MRGRIILLFLSFFPVISYAQQNKNKNFENEIRAIESVDKFLKKYKEFINKKDKFDLDFSLLYKRIPTCKAYILYVTPNNLNVIKFPSNIQKVTYIKDIKTKVDKDKIYLSVDKKFTFGNIYIKTEKKFYVIKLKNSFLKDKKGVNYYEIVKEKKLNIDKALKEIERGKKEFMVSGQLYKVKEKEGEGSIIIWSKDKKYILERENVCDIH